MGKVSDFMIFCGKLMNFWIRSIIKNGKKTCLLMFNILVFFSRSSNPSKYIIKHFLSQFFNKYYPRVPTVQFTAKASEIVSFCYKYFLFFKLVSKTTFFHEDVKISSIIFSQPLREKQENFKKNRKSFCTFIVTLLTAMFLFIFLQCSNILVYVYQWWKYLVPTHRYTPYWI